MAGRHQAHSGRPSRPLPGPPAIRSRAGQTGVRGRAARASRSRPPQLQARRGAVLPRKHPPAAATASQRSVATTGPHARRRTHRLRRPPRQHRARPRSRLPAGARNRAPRGGVARTRMARAQRRYAPPSARRSRVRRANGDPRWRPRVGLGPRGRSRVRSGGVEEGGVCTLPAWESYIWIPTGRSSRGAGSSWRTRSARQGST